MARSDEIGIRTVWTAWVVRTCDPWGKWHDAGVNQPLHDGGPNMWGFADVNTARMRAAQLPPVYGKYPRVVKREIIDTVI